MEDKTKNLSDYIKNLCEADLDRIMSFVLGIVSINQQSQEKPDCPYCEGTHVVKLGHRNGKQRFLCCGCSRTLMRSTNTLMALQDLPEQNPVLLSGIAEFDETFVLDCYKESRIPEEAGRKVRKHGAKAAKCGISNEYFAICTGVQRNGDAIAATVCIPISKRLMVIIAEWPPNISTAIMLYFLLPFDAQKI